MVREMDLRSDGSFIDAEMMIKADRMGLFIAQIRVDYFKEAVRLLGTCRACARS